jgi:hypothetical protein
MLGDMETRTAPFNAALAKTLGLRVGQTRHVSERLAIVEMPRQDWRLYDRTHNPRAKVTERWLKHAGNSHLWIGGIDTYSDEPFYYLSRLAEIAPELPHLAEWAERFRPKGA